MKAWLALAAINGVTSALKVRFGYFEQAEPMLAACHRNWFDSTTVAGGLEVACVPQPSGQTIVDRMDDGSLEMSLVGSAPLALGLSRGIGMKLVYVGAIIGDAEALVVRRDIISPLDLIGKTIATPFTSTAHYHLLAVAEQFSLQGLITIVDKAPSQIQDAWDDGSIDGGNEAFMERTRACAWNRQAPHSPPSPARISPLCVARHSCSVCACMLSSALEQPLYGIRHWTI